MEFAVTEKGNRNSNILCLIQIFVNHPTVIIVVTRLSFARMPLRYYCWNVDILHFLNCLPILVQCNQWEQKKCHNPKCNVPNFVILEMCDFDIYVTNFAFREFFEDPKFGTLHLGLWHFFALTHYTWLILVINCNNEVCAPLNNTVSKAFWN